MTVQDEYEILDISEGSYAIVYKARHKRLGYVRAVKELKTAVRNEDDKAYQTFLKECQMLMQIGNGNCPGIVKMYNPRLLGNRAVVEMDYVQGETLTQYLNRHQFMPIAEVMRMISDIGGALAYCHHDIYRFLMSAEADHLQRNPDNAAEFVISKQKERELVEKYRVVHNDLHSGNVMRREQDGGFVLLDFGLAIQNGKAVRSSAIATGAMEYRAPEKWDMSLVAKVPPQCDIYSWGILLFEALTGDVPFKCDPSRFASELAAKNEMRRLHCTVPVPAIEPLRRAAFERAHPGEKWVKDYPDWLEAMVMKCLAKKPEDRYADAKVMMSHIDGKLRQWLGQTSGQRNNEQALAQMTQQIAQLKQELQSSQERARERCSRLQSECHEQSTARKSLATANEQLKRQVDDLNKKLKNQSTRTVVKRLSPWPWMVATLVLLAATAGLVYQQREPIVQWVKQAWTGLWGETVSTLPPTAAVSSFYVDSDRELPDGLGMTFTVNATIEHMAGRRLRTVVFFYDADGRPIDDVNADVMTAYSTGEGHVCISTFDKFTHEREEASFKLSIPYGELHQRFSDTPRALRAMVAFYDESGPTPINFFFSKEPLEFYYDFKKMPSAAIKQIWIEPNVEVAGKNSMKVHISAEVNGKTDEVVYYSLLFYSGQDRHELVDSSGKQIYRVDPARAIYSSTTFNDWSLAVTRDEIMKAANYDKVKDEFVYDVVLRDDANRVLARVDGLTFKNKK